MIVIEKNSTLAFTSQFFLSLFKKRKRVHLLSHSVSPQSPFAPIEPNEIHRLTQNVLRYMEILRHVCSFNNETRYPCHRLISYMYASFDVRRLITGVHAPKTMKIIAHRINEKYEESIGKLR